MRRLWILFGLAVVVLAGGTAWVQWSSGRRPLPPGLKGLLVFVSDRGGTDALYLRRLPGGEDRLLTSLLEPTREPSFSPDGREVAFSMGGRIGVVSVSSGEVRILTLGVDWRDSTPSWRPDGKGLVVIARRTPNDNGDVHLLGLDEGGVSRSPVTQTPGMDESTPCFGSDGSFLVFVREATLFRLDLATGRTRRLTGGFRQVRHPRMLGPGRILYLWREDKRFGIDVIDANGKNRESLAEGPVYYRTIAPSPDGRFLAVTFTYDLGFHPAEALKVRQTEEVRLLDARGQPLATLARSWRHAHTWPDWASGGVDSR